MSSSSRVAPPGVDPHPGTPPILLADPAGDPPGWAAQHRDTLRAITTEHGAVLIRGLGLRDPTQTTAVFHHLATSLMTEKEAFAPRRTYPDGVYSCTPWPANQPMCMHHELSYTLQFPSLLLFACLRAPTTGGATGLADAPAILNALPPDLADRFTREGWLLTRTYNHEIGAPYTEAFGTQDRTAIEHYCHANAIAFQWHPDGTLRTRQHRSAIVRHPTTGQHCWFNQIAFLNQWTLDPEIRDYLIDAYGPHALPFNTHFGNGDPISADIIHLLNTLYDTHTTPHPWQTGDLMLVDNIRTAHNRDPYHGPRDMLVALADPVRLTDCSPTVDVSTR